MCDTVHGHQFVKKDRGLLFELKLNQVLERVAWHSLFRLFLTGLLANHFLGYDIFDRHLDRLFQ
jgi:hypothetical protein